MLYYWVDKPCENSAILDVPNSSDRGFALLLVLLGIAGLVTLGAYTFINSTGFKKYTNYNRQLELALEEPNVVLAAEYENPLDDGTQYENPFEEEPNPFADF